MHEPSESPAALFMRVLRMPSAVAEAFATAGFTAIEEVAYVPLDELLSVKSVEHWLLLELREKARQHLLDQV